MTGKRGTFVCTLVVLLAVTVTASGLTTGYSGPPSSASDPQPLADTTAPTQCVAYEGAPGGAYPNHFTITCQRAATFGGTLVNEVAVTIEMTGGWAYLVAIDVPDDAPASMARFELNEAPGAPMQDDGDTAPESSLPRQTAEWQALTGYDGNDSVVIMTSNFWAWRSNSNPYYQILYERKSFERTILIHPGVYQATVRAYLPYKDPTGQISPFKISTIGTAARKGTQSGEGITLAVGNCDEDFKAGPKLNRLDHRQLEALSKIAAGERAFQAERADFTAKSAAVGGAAGVAVVGAVETGVSVLASYEMGSIELAAASAGGGGAAASSAMDAGLLTKTGEAERVIRRELDDGRQAVRKQENGLAELHSVNEERSETLKDVERCYGGGYRIPDDYEPISRADRKDAQQPDGDTEKE